MLLGTLGVGLSHFTVRLGLAFTSFKIHETNKILKVEGSWHIYPYLVEFPALAMSRFWRYMSYNRQVQDNYVKYTIGRGTQMDAHTCVSLIYSSVYIYKHIPESMHVAG